MKTKTYSTTTHYLCLYDNGPEIELQFEPYDDNDILVQRIGDSKLVVGYLVHDDNGYSCNPMKDFDCQGDIYTRNQRVITDNEGEVYSALGLDGYGEIDRDRTLVIDGTKYTLLELAVHEFMRDEYGIDMAHEWAIDRDVHFEEDDPDFHIGVYENVYEDLMAGDFHDSKICDRVEALFREHWQKIAGPYVVPIYYCAERCRCSITTTNWGGDPNDLPNGVWVADKGAQENIDGTEGDVYANAKAYADSVVTEYASWCEGDVYGCVVEVFNNEDGEWIDACDHESCWGFIGHDYAMEALGSEFFNPTVNRHSDISESRA